MNDPRTFRALALFPESAPPAGPPAPVPLHLHGLHGLTPGEREALGWARSAAELTWPEVGCPRRARKDSLRRAEAALGDTGLGILDLGAGRAWSREALALELEHDAALAASQLFHAHAVLVRGRRGGRWLHTHGLAAAGGLDLEVLGAGAGLVEAADEFLERVGEAVLGDEVDEATRYLWLGEGPGWGQLVPVPEFQAEAARRDRRLRAARVPGHGGGRRRVLCEPDTWPPVPHRALRAEAAPTFEVPPRAQARRDARGRATLPQARRFLAELGPAVRSAWFDVLRGGEARWCELVRAGKSGFRGRGLRDGLETRVAWDEVVDWLLVTDAGEVTPRRGEAARCLREALDELEAGPPLH